jgi:hypothetical protein
MYDQGSIVRGQGYDFMTTEPIISVNHKEKKHSTKKVKILTTLTL